MNKGGARQWRDQAAMCNGFLSAARSAFLIIVFVVCVRPCAVVADDSVREFPATIKNDQLFKTLCIGEKSTGFNWHNHEWNFAHFKPEKYLVEKLKAERSQLTALCWSGTKEKTRHEFAAGALDWGCYSVREGEPGLGPPHLAHLCLEDWKTVNGSFVLQSVSCEEIKFKPDGNFTAVQWSGGDAELAEKSNYKDSLSITVGRCSIIQ
jgi:hypothetical protein